MVMSLAVDRYEFMRETFKKKCLKLLGFTEEEATSQFGFLLDAFEYGTPPHGGIALGLDRLVMLLAGRTNLRDTIAFPKTASASDLLTDAPGEVTQAQLIELHLSTKCKKITENIRTLFIELNDNDMLLLLSIKKSPEMYVV